MHTRRKHHHETIKSVRRLGAEFVEIVPRTDRSGHFIARCRWRGQPFTLGLSGSPSDANVMRVIERQLRREMRRIDQQLEAKQ